MLASLFGVISRDLQLTYRRPYEVVNALAFFVMVVALFPLGISAEPALLRRIAPGVLWVAALLSSMLSLGRMFSADHADGTLEQMLLSSEPVVLIVAGKICAHWLVTGLPLLVLAPLFALQFDLSLPCLPVLCLSLGLGTITLSLLGAIGAALTLNLQNGAVLLSVLILPLFVPVLVFGASAVNAAAENQDGNAPLFLLAGIAAGTVALAPWATTAALRISLD